MENRTTDRRTRPQRSRPPPAAGRIAVDFPFDDRASPSTAEIALVLGILPAILGDLLAGPEPPKED